MNAVGRIAVLRDLDDPDMRVFGVVIEEPDAVRVRYLVDCGLKTAFADPRVLTNPDGSERMLYPGQPEYFDDALGMLGRSFLVTAIFEGQP